jgi:tetratricopeptide (TPR) repeat protein
LIVFTLAVYLQVRDFDFVAIDDSIYITENEHVLEGLNPDTVAWAFTNFETSNWHPLTWISLMLDVEMGGSPGTFHVHNLALHIANTLLLFWLLAALTGCNWRSGIVAALFAVHPLHVESVTWIVERKDVLSALFWFVSMLAYVRYVKNPSSARYGFIVAAFVLGLMAKSMLVSLPLVLLLLDYWPLKRSEPPRKLIFEKLPLFVLSAASCAVTLAAQWGVIGSSDRIPLELRLSNALVSYIIYLRKMVWPSDLGIQYPYDRDLSPLVLVVSVLLFIGMTLLAIKLARRAPYLIVGWLWYLVTLIPVIGIVQVGVQPMADRYTYVPLLGPFIIIVWAGWELLRSKQVRWAAAALTAVIIIALAWTAYGQVEHWRNSETLFSRALEVNVENAVAHNGLADVLAGQGRTEEAIEHYRQAVRVTPQSNYARRKLAAIHARGGRMEEAIALYREAAKVEPDDAELRIDLATLLAGSGEYDEAASLFEEALQQEQGQAIDHVNYAVALSRQGRIEEAVAAFNEALEIDPELSTAHRGLAGLFAGTNQIDRAVYHLGRVVELNPGDATARLNLAMLMMRQKDLDGAEGQLTELLRLQPDNIDAHLRMAELTFRQGRIDDAIASLTEVLRIDPSREDIRGDLQRLRTMVETDGS